MKLLNHYVATKGAPPSMESLRSIVPAIFAEHPSKNVSDRYGFVSTENIINIMQEDGYSVVQARGGLRQNSRRFGVHEVRLRRTEKALQLFETFPEIVLLNSHDGTSSATLHMGLYRLICSNGMVVGDSFETSFRIPHLADPRENVITAAHHLMSSAPRLGEVIESWRKRLLSPVEISEFASRASSLRKFSGKPLSDEVTKAHRSADAGDNLWNVFNRAQENLISGGVSVINKNGKVRRTRAVRAVKPLIDLNRGLWDLAEEFLPA